MGKLHLKNSLGKPKCGRQLDNDRSTNTQHQTGASFAQSQAEYLEAILDGTGCRFCGYASGLLVKTVTIREEPSTSDDEEGSL